MIYLRFDKVAAEVVHSPGTNLADFDVGIPILGKSILGAQFKREKSTFKGESQTRFKFYHLSNPIIGNLHSATASQFGRFSRTLKPQFQRRKIDFCGYYQPNYFSH